MNDLNHLPLRAQRLKLLSTEQAAHILDLKPQTLRTWAMNGHGSIQPIKIGNRLKWRLEDIEKLIQDSGV